MPQGFGEVIEKLRRSTVAVKTHRNGGGSGVIWSAEGRIVTNAHVVEGGARMAEIEFWDGRASAAEIVRRDRRRDLALLQLEAPRLPAATTGDSNALRAGELVIAVGNPLGFIGAASTGVVHSIERSAWVISQLRLAPGNSGGPLANARGEVVGINTMISGGLAFAIPSYAVTQFLNSASQTDGELGIVVRPILTPDSERQLGLMVLEVVPQSAADRASLLQGDVLLGANGTRFQSVQDLEIAIRATGPGILELQFRRGASANVRTVAVQLAAAAVRAA